MAYTAGERAKLTALGVRGVARLLRGGPVGRIDDQIDRIQHEARLREQAEQIAREEKAARDRAEAAAKKVNRR